MSAPNLYEFEFCCGIAEITVTGYSAAEIRKAIQDAADVNYSIVVASTAEYQEAQEVILNKIGFKSTELAPRPNQNEAEARGLNSIRLWYYMTDWLN